MGPSFRRHQFPVVVLYLSSVQKVQSWSSKNVGSRRAFVAGSALTWGFTAVTQEASALQKRNEALCGTGFFTNIWQYKCTDLGDIEDEGRSRAMSAEETAKLEGLAGKLSIGAVTETAGEKRSKDDEAARETNSKEY
jgi:hypothetical protein